MGCHWWEKRNHKTLEGACHRYPPQYPDRYLLTWNTDWCGKYASRDEEEE